MHIKFSLALILSFAALVPVALAARSRDWRNPSALSRRELSPKSRAILALLEIRADASDTWKNAKLAKPFVQATKKLVRKMSKKIGKEEHTYIDETHSFLAQWALQWLGMDDARRAERFTETGNNLFGKVYAACKQRDSDFTDLWTNDYDPTTMSEPLYDVLRLPQNIQALQKKAEGWIQLKEEVDRRNSKLVDARELRYFTDDLENCLNDRNTFLRHWHNNEVTMRYIRGETFDLDNQENRMQIELDPEEAGKIERKRYSTFN